MIVAAHLPQKICPHIRQWCFLRQAVKTCHQLPTSPQQSRSTHRLAVIAFSTMLIRHPVVFTESLSSQTPDDSTDTLVALFANSYASNASRVVVAKREAAHVRPILTQLGITAAEV
jgi:hypothetical protein